VNDDLWLAPIVGADANGRAIVAYRRSLDGPVDFRRLTTRNAELFKSELYVLGTNGADAIDVALKGSSVVATVGASVRSFPASRVTALTVNALGGNDSVTNGTALAATMVGGDGNDKIQGGAGADYIRGNGGGDSLWGGAGDDLLFGDGGIDSISGQGGRDWLEGGDGADVMRGYGGRDKLFGGGGNDRMYGGESDDWLYGQGGNDQLFGGPGSDRVYGDAGNDLLSDQDQQRDTLYGGDGKDSAKLDNTSTMKDLYHEIEALV
jgi:Ca2+-binding RTX toxin-like protein